MAEELCVRLVPLFNQLSIDLQRQIERLVHHQHVRRGTVVISPDNSNRLVIIEQGQGRLYQLSATGEEQVQRILNTGDYVGETWLLGVTNSNNYVEMMKDSNICVLDHSDFTRLIQAHSDIALKLLAGQALTIDNLRQQTQLMGLPSIESRLAMYLNQLVAKQGSSLVTLPLKMKDLSSYLGTTPETLSRKLTQLQKVGKIDRHLRQIRVKELL
ncbi:Crp/Fnr family transcriptional regulator [Limosilactobacillus reuteri]|nr:Crp/Fnr family transcriptional regulator [Limosilactobacillus reuteri]MQB94490.1 Crp/Fnr family transcriptional regulator [Limosilactobacillus reuteri]OTA50003.1 Crp/Fnr family transcriptional regulator [Limosilactobacillus reuteri]